MEDTIIDDVKILLDKDYGDKRILEQILRAAENNEVISNFERNYVRKLSEKYLGRKPVVKEPPSTPDVVLPEEQPIAKTETIIQTQPDSIKSTKNNKAMIGIGAAILVVIVILGVAFSEMPLDSSDEEIASDAKQTPASNSVITLQTDLSSYSKADIISISGKSDPSLGSKISLSIENQDGMLVWSEDIKLKPDGQYTTLAIAGGEGWTTGTFTIKATHGNESYSTTFSFVG